MWPRRSGPMSRDQPAVISSARAAAALVATSFVAVRSVIVSVLASPLKTFEGTGMHSVSKLDPIASLELLELVRIVAVPLP